MIRCFCLALLVACVLPFAATAQVGPPQDRYIVVLNEGLDLPEDVAADVAQRTGGQVGYVYGAAIRGFTITVPQAAVAGIERDRRVAYVEEDRPVHTFDQALPTGIERIFADLNTDINIDGVDERIDVDVAVIDTGIDIDHEDLSVYGGANCLSHSGGPPWARQFECDPNGNFDDGHSHGTHVAGTIGAIDNGLGVVGVAPGARLWAVKVLDDTGSGSLGSVIAGIDWVVDTNLADNGENIEVINMSLGGAGWSDAMDQSITAAVDVGVTVVVAAGNDSVDLKTNDYSPASLTDSFTVSALADFDGAPYGNGTTCRSDHDDADDDTLATFSNFDSTDGEPKIINMIAPGVCIFSSVPDNGYASFSGTSMASPHVAGAAALVASGDPPPLSREEVYAIRQALIDAGNTALRADGGWDDSSNDGNKEPLLDAETLSAASDEDSGGGDTNNPPAAEFSASCANLECDFTDQSTDDGTIMSWAWDFGDGGSSTVQNPSYAFDCDGTYSVTLTVTDDDGATGSTSKDVTVSNGTVCSSMHVGDLDGSAVKNGPTWSATVTITVHDSSEGLVENATVSGTWSPVGTSEPCTTGSTGQCSMTAAGLPNNAKSVDFTVDAEPNGVVHESYTYDSAANHDEADGDNSDGTSITIARP